MKTIKEKHLTPYIPYRVKFKIVWESSFRNQPDTVETKILTCQNISSITDKRYKKKSVHLILRPLSQLTEEIEHNGEKFIPEQELRRKAYTEFSCFTMDYFITAIFNKKGYDIIPHWMFQDLIKWHFDVFGLLDEGLAIN